LIQIKLFIFRSAKSHRFSMGSAPIYCSTDRCREDVMWTTATLHLLIPTALMLAFFAWLLAAGAVHWLRRRHQGENWARRSEPRLRVPARQP
jgi:hypothetical protein